MTYVVTQQAHTIKMTSYDNIKMTSYQRRCDVIASTLIRRHFNVVCPLGRGVLRLYMIHNVKKYLRTCAPCDDTDYSVRVASSESSVDSQRFKVSSGGQRRLIELRACAADLSLLWAHMSEGKFSHVTDKTHVLLGPRSACASAPSEHCPLTKLFCCRKYRLTVKVVTRLHKCTCWYGAVR